MIFVRENPSINGWWLGGTPCFREPPNGPKVNKCSLDFHVFMSSKKMCIYVTNYIYIFDYIYLLIFVCIYIYMYVYIYICMYLCMYIGSSQVPGTTYDGVGGWGDVKVHVKLQMMMMMMMMMMMTLMKLVNSATKFRHGIDKFYQPNSGLRGSWTEDRGIYIYVYIYIYIYVYIYIYIYGDRSKGSWKDSWSRILFISCLEARKKLS